MFKDFKIKMFNFSYLKYHLKLSIFKFYEIYECMYIYLYIYNRNVYAMNKENICTSFDLS